MPTNGTITYAGNTYAGEVLEDLLVYTSQENDTFQEGLIHIKPGIQHKFVLPHVTLGKIIQDNVPTPTSAHGAKGDDGKNEYTFSERYLEPNDFMVYIEFNPRDYESYWKPFQPDGQLLFRELDPKVQATMLRLISDKKEGYMGDCIWASAKGGKRTGIESDSADNTEIGGETEAGPMKYFDGAIARMIDNINATDANEKATGQVIMAGNTAMTTGEQVEKALYAMWRKCPKNLRKNKKMVFVMGWDLWDLYDQYLSSKDVKYTENADVNKYKFKGKRVVVINGITEQTIVFGKFTTGTDSCLWMGVDYAADQESIKIAPLQNNSEMWFFQMRLKVDVNIVLPSEIILWTTYKKKAGQGA